MVSTLSETQRRAARVHFCYDCGRAIPKGALHFAGTYIADGRAYTLRMHTDCREAALDYISHGYEPDYYDGIPPLREMIWNGDGQRDLDAMRGLWPHVVCRIELARQLALARPSPPPSDKEKK